jgi:hypothetical protein
MEEGMNQRSALSPQPSAAPTPEGRPQERASTIGPGPVLVELRLLLPVPKEVLYAGLKEMGFTEVTIANVSKDRETKQVRIRFLGKLARAVSPTDTEILVWTEREPVTIDAFGAAPVLEDSTLTPFVLQPDGIYELRFVARVRAHPNADAVADALEDMGFEVNELIALARVDDPKAGNVQVQVWYGRGIWRSTLSVVTPEDPFFFAEAKKIGNAPPEKPEPEEDRDEA